MSAHTNEINKTAYLPGRGMVSNYIKEIQKATDKHIFYRNHMDIYDKQDFRINIRNLIRETKVPTIVIMDDLRFDTSDNIKQMLQQMLNETPNDNLSFLILEIGEPPTLPTLYPNESETASHAKQKTEPELDHYRKADAKLSHQINRTRPYIG